MNINFSEVFKKLRRERELTQEQAAEAFSVSTQAVSRWENGQTSPDISLLPIIAEYSTRRDFAAVVPISAADGTNVNELIDEAKKFLPEGVQYYPADMVTDQPERLIIAELIREKLLHATQDEVPHAIAVDLEEFTPRDNGTIFIRATIYVERDSQKGILIGKGGKMLKQVGKAARPEIEMLLGAKVFLDLWVKVKRDWRNSIGALQSFGLKDF